MHNELHDGYVMQYFWQVNGTDKYFYFSRAPEERRSNGLKTYFAMNNPMCNVDWR